ncbi:MAG: glycosyltransferase family 9 protein [Phycisphaerae bacterium]|nr:glycosyltransferase family 9 protein [Phycisphaerae bacterium]NNF42139.1 glycosyltransferase family 9 protein [Phycisphaerales bacterium]
MTDHHIGNFAISAPVIRRLIEHFDEPVDTMVDGSLVELARLLLDTERVLPARRRRGVGGIAEMTRLGAAVAGRYHAVIDVGSGVRSSAVVACSLARRRIGLDSYRRGWAYNHRLPDHAPDHVFDRYAQMLAAIGETTRPDFLSIDAPAAARTAAADALSGAFASNEPYAVVHAGAGKPHRIWPAERFSAVADRIVREHGLPVCFIGTPQERERVERVRAGMRSADQTAFVSVGILPLIALLERAALLFCNESGPMHLAALTRCPIVAIYGPTSMAHWSPLREQGITMLTGHACPAGCTGGRCVAESRCLTGVSIDDAADAVAVALGRASGNATGRPREARMTGT